MYVAWCHTQVISGAQIQNFERARSPAVNVAAAAAPDDDSVNVEQAKTCSLPQLQLLQRRLQ
jgi:hypothetical protein